MSYNFVNRVGIITGGLSGIGLATVEKLLGLGAKIVVGDITPSDKATKTLDDLKAKGFDLNNLEFVRADSTLEDDNKKLLKTAIDKFDGLDFIFANAGIATAIPAHEMSLEKYKKVIDVNLNGVFILNTLAINYWLENNKKGAIVNTGSILSFVGFRGLAHYCSSKGGVKLLTQTLCLEYASKGIRINSVNPGYINTPLLEFLPKKEYDNLINLHPAGRLGEPNEIANAVAFLLSDEASFINGISLLVDGGYTAQ